MPAALELRNVSKTFGANRALVAVDLAVEHGEVLALVGQNGSGKSTLVKILAGFHEPDPGGELVVDGEPVPLPLPPGRFRELGLSFVHQDLGLAGGLTVLENLTIGRRGGGARPIDWRQERRRAAEVLASYDVPLDPEATVRDLAPVGQALLAIVRAAEELREFRLRTGREHSILVLDEPTVFLAEADARFLFDLVRTVTRTSASVIFISHDLDAVRQVADRVTVLRDGRVAGTAPVAGLDRERLVDMIVGREAAAATARAGRHSPPAQDGGSQGLVVRALAGDRVRDVSLTVMPGEIVGVAGLMGSGAEELPLLLFGGLPASAGELTVGGRRLDARHLSPPVAIDAGLALVPADRAREGVAGRMSVEDNMLLLAVDRFYRRGWLHRRLIDRTARSRCATFDVRPPEPSIPLSTLSGGNQQKVVLAKWLEIKPRVMLLHSPTQGVDVGARAQVYQLVRDAVGAGTAVLWVTPEFEELAEMCDRVLVMAEGRVAGEIRGPGIDKDEISHAVFAASAATAVAGGHA